MHPENDVDFDKPPQELLEWAKKHIREDPNVKCQMLSDFENLIYANGDCDPIRTDEAFLLRFLRARNYRLPSAYKLFLKYHSFRKENPEFFENINVERLVNLIEKGAIISLSPYREGSGRRILSYKWSNWSPDDYPITELFQASVSLLDMGSVEERSQILGGICIMDFKDFNFQQASHITPSAVLKISEIIVSFPLKLSSFHILNESRFFYILYNVVKPFISSFMTTRIFFHGSNLESLHQHVDPKYLPEEYGGTQIEGCLTRLFRDDNRLINELKLLRYKFVESKNNETQEQSEERKK